VHVVDDEAIGGGREVHAIRIDHRRGAIGGDAAAQD
jgi:hypothetical protein